MQEKLNHESQKEFSFKSYFVPLTTIKAIHFIIIIGLIIFCNGLFNGFVGDDSQQIVQNPVIQSIQNFPSFFLGGTFYGGEGEKLGGTYYRPLELFFYADAYSISGINAFTFHFIQIIFYIANACLVYLIFKRFFNNSLAFVLSIIFLVHPINSEVALYLADMQDTLYFFFGILSFWILLKYSSQKYYILASLFLLLSLFSKETGILFFVIDLCYLFSFKRKSFTNFLGYSSLSFIVYLITRISAIGITNSSVANAPIENLSLLGRFINMPAMFLFYIKTFFFPLIIATDYQWVFLQIQFNSFWLPTIIDLLFLVLLACFSFILYKKYSKKYFVLYNFFALWFFLGMILNMQTFYALDATVADRWFYIPIVGLLGMIGVVCDIYRLSLKNAVTIICIVLIIALLSTRTFIRSFDWRNDYSIAMHDLKYSTDAWGIETALSNYYIERGDYKDAQIHAEKSVQIFPFLINYTVLGTVYLHQKEYAQAKSAYMHALQYGDVYATYENLAVLATFYGDPKENIAFIKDNALKKYHYDAKLWLCLAIIEYKYGDKNDAQNDIQQAYNYDPEPEVSSIYNTITNNKPLKLQLGE